MSARYRVSKAATDDTAGDRPVVVTIPWPTDALGAYGAKATGERELDAWVEPFDPHPTKESNHVQGVHQLPTSDLERSKAFYTALGCAIAPEFTDENAACVVWSDDTFFMVLTREYFSTFTDKPIVDPNEAAQVSVAFARDSREDVDDVMAKGLAAGGAEPKAAQDLGFMYSRDLDDPDGNSLGFLYMEPMAAEQGPDAYLAQQGETAQA